MICQNLYYFCPPTGRGAAMMPALVREGRLTGFAMRYLGRLVAYLAVFFSTFSLGYTLLLRWVPVTLTPLKAIRLAEHLPEEGLRVRSNWVPLRKVAMPMVRAVIATEDNHFLSHRGFDWDAIDRALDENREGKRLRGGSTISQQTAKNVFCLPARTWLRKGGRGVVHRTDRDFLEQAADHGGLSECHRNGPQHVWSRGSGSRRVRQDCRRAERLRGLDDSDRTAQSAPPRHGRSVGLHGAPGLPRSAR